MLGFLFRSLSGAVRQPPRKQHFVSCPSSVFEFFNPMPNVPGLRSPYAKVGRIVYFGRMLDKIRLQAAGTLPPDYIANLGKGFDDRCVNFLRINYDDLKARVLTGDLNDAQLLAWAEQRGGGRTDEECEVWSGFMMKRGFRDEAAETLAKRIRESRLEGRPITTMFDYLDFDEGRDPVTSRAWEQRAPTVVMLMGVAGSGKTTIGAKLAAGLGWSFRDADDFHPAANVAKMSSGVPLTDADRAPWLAAIRRHIEESLGRGESGVVTCSALKESYRAAAIPAGIGVKLVHLAGDFNLILERMNAREGHFMKPEMLKSQFETLQPPAHALTVNVAQNPDAIVEEIRRALAL
jgi:carbohydrate kinase (thermoresistant glucokinase family)